MLRVLQIIPIILQKVLATVWQVCTMGTIEAQASGTGLALPLFNKLLDSRLTSHRLACTVRTLD